MTNPNSEVPDLALDPSAPSIELVNVTQHYGVKPVLREISFAIDPAQVVVIVGPNGMGKSTLLGAMSGVLSPQQGTVYIGGHARRSSVAAERAIRKNVVYMPDRPWLPANRTGREYLLSVGQLYEIDAERLIDHVPKLAEVFELEKQIDAPIRSYSSGQQKKISLCAALVTEAPIMLLDEPFSGGLDPAGLSAIKRLLRWRVDHQGATVVLTSPVPELVDEIADRILILKEGRVHVFDALDQLRARTGLRSLSEILERLLYPETSLKLDNYLAEQR